LVYEKVGSSALRLLDFPYAPSECFVVTFSSQSRATRVIPGPPVPGNLDGWHTLSLPDVLDIPEESDNLIIRL
jgi:hypothetical protein